VTAEYRDSYKKNYDEIYLKRDLWDSHRRYSDWDEKKLYYYKDVPRMRGFVKRSCYESAPAGKLFYFKC